ncbi:2,3-bisphosphoglycerate-independent phosphoglycerate mutase [candidate division KSB1 bacterium]|nr:2,3-bisphosphoglycerate-independent phosphoglycerate mutase [candidate division KSB1 bacterium]
MGLQLKKLDNFKPRKGPLLLIIMDGVGLAKPGKEAASAVAQANTPHLDRLLKSELFTTLKAHGTAVGLPSDSDMGNSEVGHNALGAGRVFAQGAKLVDRAIENSSLFNSEHFKTIVARAKAGKTVHFIGLFSDGNVHSHLSHLHAMIDYLVKQGAKRIRIHPLWDGRDVPERSALDFLLPFEEKLSQLRQEGTDIKIASGGGRMNVTMDRYEANWQIVKKGWDAHVLGKGRAFASAKEAVEFGYSQNLTDQYLDSFVIVEHGEPVGRILDGDQVIYFNFRGDRAIEISRAFDEENFSYFDRDFVPKVDFYGMMEYDGDLHIPKKFLVNPPMIERTVSAYLAAEKVTSFAISETQKYGHVTYFWNGNRSGYIDAKLEKYIEIPSDIIPFDQKPKMKAREITEKTIELLKSGKYQFGRLNFPNGDMVGHTGVMDAAIVAMETVDEYVGKLIDVVNELDGVTIVTADHGNSDEMWTEEKGKRQPKTAHTLNPVPFVIIDKNWQGEYEINREIKGGLANVAATLLNLLGFEKVADYEPSLIKFK